MSQKNKDKIPNVVEDQSRENNNTILIVIFSIVIFILLVLAALGWGLFLYQKKEGGQATKNLDLKVGGTTQGTWSPPNGNVPPPVSTNSNISPSVPASKETSNSNQNIAEPPQVPSEEVEGFLPPSTSEKNMGYIKKVYVKNGQNYLDIDYIQWFTGTEAEKAMREDGKCPKKGECIVYNDYYIRNQNTLIRSFEVSPSADIRMQTLDSETTGSVDQNKKITFEKLKEVFASGSTYKEHYQFVPFIVEIGNKQIVKITEQYIP